MGQLRTPFAAHCANSRGIRRGQRRSSFHWLGSAARDPLTDLRWRAKLSSACSFPIPSSSRLLFRLASPRFASSSPPQATQSLSQHCRPSAARGQRRKPGASHSRTHGKSSHERQGATSAGGVAAVWQFSRWRRSGWSRRSRRSRDRVRCIADDGGSTAEPRTDHAFARARGFTGSTTASATPNAGTNSSARCSGRTAGAQWDPATVQHATDHNERALAHTGQIAFTRATSGSNRSWRSCFRPGIVLRRSRRRSHAAGY
jgi:hypothetical protein